MRRFQIPDLVEQHLKFAPASEFVVGIVSAPASGVAQSLARLIFSSKVPNIPLLPSAPPSRTALHQIAPNMQPLSSESRQVAASVQILPGVTSIYESEGKVVYLLCAAAAHAMP